MSGVRASAATEHQWGPVYVHDGHYPDGRQCFNCGAFDLFDTSPFCPASGMSALGQDPLAGLEAKPASPVPEGGDAKP